MTHAIRPDKRDLGILVCLLLLFSLGSASWSADPPQYLGLTILHTNDIHGHLFPLTAYDVKYDATDVEHLTDVGGAARRATLIRRIKQASPDPVLVMDAGDVWTRGPIGGLKGEADIEVMNAIGYDVMTLGNNEFKGAEGIAAQQVLFDRIKQAKFPVLSANVFRKSTGKEIVEPYKIFNLQGVKIGVFGLTAPRVGGYRSAEGLEVRNPIGAAKAVVAELRQKADFIIALTHIGYATDPFACDLMLAAAVPGIDVIVGGDSHTWLREPTVVAPPQGSTESASYVRGTIVTQVGEWGVRIGRLDLRLRRAEDNRYRVMSYTAKMIDVTSAEAPAKDIEQIIDRHTKSMRKELARLDKAVSKAEMGQYLAQCIRVVSGTQIGLVSSDAIEDGLRAGAVTELDLRRMCPWQDTDVLKTILTGKQLRDVIAQRHPFLAGAKTVDGVLYVGDARAADDASYTVALGDVYWLADSSVKEAKTQSAGMTLGSAVVSYLTMGGDARALPYKLDSTLGLMHNAYR